RDAVQRHPFFHAHADCRDLVLTARAEFRPAHPDADALFAPLARDAELRERADDPFLKARHIAAQVLAAFAQVEHGVGHALAGPVIGEAAAAARFVEREADGAGKIVGAR